MRSPRGTPYFNPLQELKSDKRRIKRWIDFAKTNFRPMSEKNANLFEPKTADVSYLTSSVLMIERSKRPDPGDSLKFNPQLERMRSRAKKLRVLKEPNLTIYNQTQTKLRQQEEERIRKEKEEKELAEKLKPVNINTLRYNSKINDVANKTLTFRSVDDKTLNALATFTQLKAKESFDLAEMTNKIQPYETKTFDKQIHLKQSRTNSLDMSLKPASFYLEKSKIETSELKGIEVKFLI